MFVIMQKREFYGPTYTRDLVSDLRGYAETFGTRAAAKAKILELNSGVYHLAHNETSRPDYTVRHVDSLSAHHRKQVGDR